MNVSLTPQLEKMIRREIKTGRYQSASEVVREALRLLQDRERDRHRRHRELREDIAVGIRQLDRGERIPFDEELIREISREGRRRLVRKNRVAANGRRR